MDLKNFQSLSIFDKTATIAFFVTIFFAICIIAILAISKKRNDSQVIKRYVVGFVFGYSLSVILLLGFLKLDEYSAAGYTVKTSFYPVLAFVLTVLVLAVCAIVILLFKKEKFSLFAKIAGGIVGAFAIALIIALGVTNNGMVLSKADNAMLYIFTIVIVAIIVLLAVFCGKKEDPKLHTKSIVYASLSIALSFALSYVRFFELPQGGSITLASILPLLIYSYMFGIRRGIVAGVIYGFLQFIQAPWLYHPVQFLLDYPIAFSAIGLCGLFKEVGLFKSKPIVSFLLGGILAAVLRYLSHVISGVFIFGSADASYSAVAWSFLYNSFVFADLAIALVCGSLMFASKEFVKRLDVTASIKKEDMTDETENDDKPNADEAPIENTETVQTKTENTAANSESENAKQE